MKKIAIMNYKGGVGKTTLTANIGAELAWRGYNVLLVDLDPQASLTFSFITPDDWREKYAASHTIKEFFDAFDDNRTVDLTALIESPERVARRLRANTSGTLKMIYSHLGLINVDLELASSLSGATPKQQSERYLRVHNYLRDSLNRIDQSAIDYVLFDCPPNFGIVTRNAIVASDGIVVPAKPDYLSTLGIDYLKGKVDELMRHYNHFGHEAKQRINIDIVGVIFTMVSEMNGGPQLTLQRYMSQVKSQGQVRVFDAYMKENKRYFGAAPEDGVPVVLNLEGNQTLKSVRQGLEDIVDEFIAKA
ncbi:ParA family protein [Azospirillum argentinense]